MALRDQPYLPLYVQDFMTDEALNECSAQATGVYIRIMCVMHKSKEYGTILLKQKGKQSESTCLEFANKLAKHLTYSTEVIKLALDELVEEEVLIIEGDKLIQKRMVKDNALSLKRAQAGKKGGLQSSFAKANIKPKGQANSENEDEIENEVDIEEEIEIEIGGLGERIPVIILSGFYEGWTSAFRDTRGSGYVTTEYGNELQRMGEMYLLHKAKSPEPTTTLEMNLFFNEFLYKTKEHKWWSINAIPRMIVNKFNEAYEIAYGSGGVKTFTYSEICNMITGQGMKQDDFENIGKDKWRKK